MRPTAKSHPVEPSPGEVHPHPFALVESSLTSTEAKLCVSTRPDESCSPSLTVSVTK